MKKKPSAEWRPVPADPAPLPRTPVEDPDTVQFFEEVAANFLALNAGAALLLVLSTSHTHTRGSTASAHLDPATGKPLVVALRDADARAVPAPLPARDPGAED